MDTDTCTDMSAVVGVSVHGDLILLDSVAMEKITQHRAEHHCCISTSVFGLRGWRKGGMFSVQL